MKIWPNFRKSDVDPKETGSLKTIEVYPEEKQVLDKYLAEKGIAFACVEAPDGVHEYVVAEVYEDEIIAFLDALHPDELVEMTSDNDGVSDEKDIENLILKAAPVAAPVCEMGEQREIQDAADEVIDFGILTIEEQRRLDEERAKEATGEKKPKKRITLGRNNEVKVRLTDDEKTRLQTRILESGLKQGEFVRRAILTGRIDVQQITSITKEHMEEVMRIGSELSKIGGLIKKTVSTNNEFGVLTPEQKAELEREIKELASLRRKIQGVVEDIYGTSETR